MTTGIKRMLAERAALASPPKEKAYDPHVHLFEMIDRAAPFMDEGSHSNKWRPSELLKISFFMMSTGPSSDGQTHAANYVLKILDRARELYIDGKHPNPWA